ncbi:MAG: hypothetical protein J6B37_07260 [Clostridia bacterium]|nr:hypothetical protein [Clostridia bacterium]
MRQLARKLQQFMVGRYGNDEFTLFLSLAGLILGLLANFKYLGFLYYIGAILIIFGLFRTLSKNYNARRKELNWYLLWSAKPKAEIKLLINRIQERETHKYFKCKNCKAVLRVPKGRGKIEITCPKCRAKVIKKT